MAPIGEIGGGTQPARKARAQMRQSPAKWPLLPHCVPRLALLRTLINLDNFVVLPVANVRVEGSNPFARSNKVKHLGA